MTAPKTQTKQTGVEFGYGLRSTLAQCLMLSTAYFLNVQQGIDIMMPTLIIGAQRDKKDKDLIPNITETELSWIGSLVYLSPPIGSFFLSLVLDRLGHRVCMGLTNFVQLSPALVLLLFPLRAETLYACSMLMGLATGFATGLSISYSGEVCEPKLRGTLTSALNVFYFVGFFFVSTVNAVTCSWMTSLLITVVVPLINIAVVILTPDSPMWLLSKGKEDKAKRNLRKLRGGVTDDKCAKEFHEMVQYVSHQSTNADDANGHPQQYVAAEKPIRWYVDPGLWRPLKLVLIYIFFSNLMSGVPYQPFLITIIPSFGADVDAAWATAAYTVASIIGNVFTILLVHRLGKRFLVLSTILVSSMSYLFIGVIGLTDTTSVLAGWTKLGLFFAAQLSSSLGIMPIGWILVSEVFPMRSKNLGTSISSGVYFLMSFFMTKFYLDLESFTGFYNTFALFGASGLGSLVYFYFNLPETENKTLKEIAGFFKLEPV